MPIHKGDSKKDVQNYRPVSLTCIVCKSKEHIIYSAIMSQLTENNIVIKVQYGFRKGLSCTTQLVEFYHELGSEIDAEGQIDFLFLDFRKDLNTVTHLLLIYKLQLIGIHRNAVMGIESFLSERRQCVVINGKKSRFVNVTSGVSRSSALGPLLFFIYINDINLGITSSSRLFADDCVAYRSISYDEDATALQEDLNRINDWCKQWNMCLNVNKCIHMCSTRKKTNDK